PYSGRREHSHCHEPGDRDGRKSKWTINDERPKPDRDPSGTEDGRRRKERRRKEKGSEAGVFAERIRDAMIGQTAPQSASQVASPPEAKIDHVLQTDQLVKIYGGRAVVNGVNINARAGEIVGLLGPNGAGKTTSFYMIVGLVRPNSGRVLFS